MIFFSFHFNLSTKINIFPIIYLYFFHFFAFYILAPNLKMYFIVYILQTRRYVIVPYTWTRISSRFENLINNGINSGIAFTVFYTNNTGAFDNGIPRASYEPNPHASLFSQFPQEGWYDCRIQRFFGN